MDRTLAPASDAERMDRAHLAGADVVVLDLAELVPEAVKPAARETIEASIQKVKTGGAEVFVQVDPELIYADLQASVWPGLTGIVLARMESPQQVEEADELLGRLEEERRDEGRPRPQGGDGQQLGVAGAEEATGIS